ncbi:MAG TPA: hypothetical protein VMC07_00470 [Candidatus Omnitrophota bacterium]|nr:hypothetical protein [Candidatus Omnitrophota bacterium]
MNQNSFKTISEGHNKRWLSPKIGIPAQFGGGIDFLDDFFAIELKGGNKSYHDSFAVHSYQIGGFKRAYPGREFFWAFLLYDTTKPICDMTESENIAKFMVDRDVWFLEWDWIRQFPVHYAPTGPYVYPKKKDFPADNYFRKIKVQGGRLYVPNDSSLDWKLGVKL